MIIVLYGEDTFRSREKLHEIEEKFIREADPSRLNFQAYDASKMDFGAFKQAVTSAPFLAKKRMAVFERLMENKELAEETAEFLNNLPSTQDNVLVFWEEAFDKKHPLAPLFKKAQFSQEFTPLSSEATKAWIRERVKSEGAEIDAAATQLLLEYIGNDLWALSHEINKLIAFLGEEKIIKPHCVRELTSAKSKDDIFGLVDAIGMKNKKLATDLLKSQWQFGSPPLHILSMLARQYRILLQVRDHAGETSDSLAKKLKLHPFVVKKSLAQARKYSEADLKKMYTKILEMDRLMKTAPFDPEFLIEKFIASA